jgi:hypothetical protein
MPPASIPIVVVAPPVVVPAVVYTQDLVGQTGGVQLGFTPSADGVFLVSFLTVPAGSGGNQSSYSWTDNAGVHTANFGPVAPIFVRGGTTITIACNGQGTYDIHVRISAL